VIPPPKSRTPCRAIRGKACQRARGRPRFAVEKSGRLWPPSPSEGAVPRPPILCPPCPMLPGRAARPYTLRQLSPRAPRPGNACGENLKSLDVSAILVINKDILAGLNRPRKGARRREGADPDKGLSKRDARSGTPFLGPMRKGIFISRAANESARFRENL
jgi:hypothetical protein